MEGRLLKKKINLMFVIIFIVLMFFLALISFTGLRSDQAWLTSEKKLDRAEKRWNSMHINSYTIQVQERGWWYAQNYTVVVRKGKVVDFSGTCALVEASEPCQVSDLNAEGFTVPNLFAIARTKAYAAKIGFDASYGFPSTIRYNDPRLADEEEEWTVLEFVPENP